jgi:hypothetical protein
MTFGANLGGTFRANCRVFVAAAFWALSSYCGVAHADLPMMPTLPPPDAPGIPIPGYPMQVTLPGTPVPPPKPKATFDWGTQTVKLNEVIVNRTVNGRIYQYPCVWAEVDGSVSAKGVDQDGKPVTLPKSTMMLGVSAEFCPDDGGPAIPVKANRANPATKNDPAAYALCLEAIPRIKGIFRIRVRADTSGNTWTDPNWEELPTSKAYQP